MVSPMGVAHNLPLLVHVKLLDAAADAHFAEYSLLRASV